MIAHTVSAIMAHGVDVKSEYNNFQVLRMVYLEHATGIRGNYAQKLVMYVQIQRVFFRNDTSHGYGIPHNPYNSHLRVCSTDLVKVHIFNLIV